MAVAHKPNGQQPFESSDGPRNVGRGDVLLELGEQWLSEVVWRGSESEQQSSSQCWGEEELAHDGDWGSGKRWMDLRQRFSGLTRHLRGGREGRAQVIIGLAMMLSCHQSLLYETPSAA